MQRKLWLALLASTGPLLAQDAAAVLQAAEKAMGSVKSIRYSGSGINGNFGQSLLAGKEWPRRELTSYTRTINYELKSSSEELVFAQPVFGGQRQNAEVHGDKAWTVGANGPVPQLAASDERQLQIWLTPHGFLLGAKESGNATLKSGNLVAFTALGRYKIEGMIDSQNLVARVETKVDNPLLGDTTLVTRFTDYKDYGGVKFPGKILQTEGGFPVLDLTVTKVEPNAPADLPVPSQVLTATPPKATVSTAKLADGVWFLTGGSHHSLVVEFKKYIAVVEAPLNEERSLAVLAEAKSLVYKKPVKYLISTHHHFDHSGGLRTYVAEGAIIVTHASNKSYYQAAFSAPATIAPDSLAKNSQKARFVGVKDKYVLSDGTRKIEVYATHGDNHTDELLVAYLPASKILVEADSYSPGPPNAPPPSTPPPNAVALYDNIQRLKLDVATIAPIHGRGAVSMSEFLAFIGKH